MAWIESHQSLLKHPKISRFARILGINKAEAIGRLHMLWWWSLDYAQNGDLSGYYADEIAEASDWKEDSKVFVSALIQSGFLDDNPLRLHDWGDYAGRLIERREKNAERQRKHRENLGAHSVDGVALQTLARDKRVTSQARHIATVPNRTVPNRTVPNQTNTTREKNICAFESEGAQSSTGKDAEGKQTPDVSAEKSDEYTSEFLEFWECYPRRVDKQRAFRVWKIRLKEKHLPNDMIQAALNYATYCSSQRTEVRFIKHPATFLGPDKSFMEFINGYALPAQTNNVGVNDVLERARQTMFGGGDFDIGASL